MFQGLFKSGVRKTGLPDEPDKLLPEHLRDEAECLLLDSGMPDAVDSSAYDPIQKLLAVGTSDGRVKLFGRLGVEKTLYSSARKPSGTKQLVFHSNRGILLRLSKAGIVEVWDLIDSALGVNAEPEGAKSKPSLKLEDGDKVRCLAPFFFDPYVALGCSSGSIRFAMLIDKSGQPMSSVRPAHGLRLAQLSVSATQLQSAGEVTELSARSVGNLHRLLALHAPGWISVWDVRSNALAASLRGDNALMKRFGVARCSCWMGGGGGVGTGFATGHERGDILIWALPPLGAPVGTAATVLHSLRVTELEDAMAVRCLLPISSRTAAASAAGGPIALLTLGGGPEEQPDGLSLVPVPPSQELSASSNQSEEEVVSLPWVGHILGLSLLPPPGSLAGNEDPIGIIQLLEGGQVALQNPDGGEDVAIFTPPLQAATQAPTKIVCAEMYCLPLERKAQHAAGGLVLTLSDLRAAAAKRIRDSGPRKTLDTASTDTLPDALVSSFRVASAALDAHGAEDLATPSPSQRAQGLSSIVYCTGHQDGHVRLWDMYGEQPQLLLSAPSDAAARPGGLGPNLKSVTVLELRWEHGVLVTGHSKGEVRLYTFSIRSNRGSCVCVSEIGTHPASTSTQTVNLEEGPGLQLRLRSWIHADEITALSYSSTNRAVVVGDKCGGVSLLDMITPAVLWYVDGVSGAIKEVSLGLCSPPSATGSSGRSSKEPHSSVNNRSEGASGVRNLIRSAFYATCEGAVGVMSHATGEPISKNVPFSPKNSSAALCMDLLDEAGIPIWMSRHRFGHKHLAASASGRASSGLSTAADENPEAKRRGGGSIASTSRSSAYQASVNGGKQATAHSRADDDGESEEEEDDYLASAVGRVQKEQRDARIYRRRKAVKDVFTKGVTGVAGVVTGVAGVAETVAEGMAGVVTGVAGTVTHGVVGVTGEVAEKLGLPWTPGLDDDEPYLDYEGDGSGDPLPHEPEVVYVLLCTETHLRVYSVDNILSGDKGTEAKVALASQLLYAHTFHSEGAPGLLALTSGDDDEGPVLEVYSLPSLGLLMQTPISTLTGEVWQAPPAGKAAKLTASSRLGHLTLLSPLGEVSLLAVTKSIPEQHSSRGIYDWDLAEAAQAALLAHAQGASLLQSAPSSVAPSLTFSTAGAVLLDEEEEGLSASAVAAPKQQQQQQQRGAAGIFGNLGGAFSKVQQTMAKGFVDPMRILAGGFSSDPMQQYEAQNPDLGTVITNPNSSLSSLTSAATGAGAAASSGSGSSAPVTKLQYFSAALPTAAASSSTSGGVGDRGAKGASTLSRGGAEVAEEEGDEEEDAVEGSGPPVARTVSQVRRQYRGSTASDRTKQVHEVAIETRRKLEERGQKLKQLDERASDLENSAAGFAELAKQLKDKQKKSWW
ncbi:hypothetical protein CEUSTIGMA_g7856.t1 [Chlamydomonas eustigma]|uniref:V-SNARE coiled-coil homology domain-containing protein n=1 Tax=Chlamydomonas eustigma TaxID=1157962 RepID=A0A250XBG1_9CHLO|nr:hypothetical protein CEUSTIGMA_g7856.t1 [Chlamydomonas eustigma]|eukprot:GAX80417.1 hypothetical protein CEUSTIGMA_g7856.t1 [Chlamydomonas eustigma]